MANIITNWLIIIWGIFVALYLGGNGMEWWQSLLIGMVPALIGLLGTIYGYRKSSIHSNTQEVKKLSDKLGNFDNSNLDTVIGVPEKGKNLTLQNKEIKAILNKDIPEQIDEIKRSISGQLGVTNRSVTEQLGVSNNDLPISDQIKNIFGFIKEDKAEKSERFKAFKKKQKDTIQKVEEISDFLKDWENLNIENEKIKQAYLELQAESARLLQRVDELEDELERVQ